MRAEGSSEQVTRVGSERRTLQWRAGEGARQGSGGTRQGSGGTRQVERPCSGNGNEAPLERKGRSQR